MVTDVLAGGEVASCSYVTLNDGGIKHYDPAATGTLRFAPGESSKTFPIAISDNGRDRGTRALTIVLSDNEGNATLVGGIKEAAVTVLRRDTGQRKNPN